MRVIAGSAKGRKLKSVPGDSTRPILDRIKENLFNILGVGIRDTRCLDLFAGTGSIGIEALSRSAEYCLFLDLDSGAVRTIEENLAITGLADRAEVRQTNAFTFLSTTPAEDTAFELIFVAPPQYKGLWLDALKRLDVQPDWLYPDGVIVVQIDPKEYEETSFTHLGLYDQRKYGKTMLCFYERPSE